MKVIGMADREQYLVVVSHTELEMVAGKYYGNMERLKVGDSMDLGAGYSYRSDIKSACDGMAQAVQGFERAQKTLMKFALLVAQLPPEDQGAIAAADPAGGAK